VLNLLRNNFGLKLLSVFLAVAAWAYFHLAAPAITARFDQTFSVPIAVSGLKPGYQAHYTEKVVTVVVEVPRNGPVVRQDQLQAVLDASDLVDPGYHNVQVKLVAPDVAIKSITPASVTLALDRVDERTVPVSIVYAGASTGVVVEAAHVDPGLTTIRGVSGDLRRVSGVRVVIPIPAKPNRLDAMLQPTPIDARGNEIAGVHVSPNLVRVRADFVTPLAPGK
jgi:hypothetical protein